MANTNGFDPAAWAIDGARVGSDLARVAEYAATGGAEGIIQPLDCKVHQLGVAGPQIVIDPGAAVVRNRSANVRNQSYVANGRLQSIWDVTPTGGAARSDVVGLRIKDPQYSPWVLPGGTDPETYQYVEPFIIEGVSSSLTSLTSLNLGYSAIPLARITRPAGTTNVLDSHITDLRQLAQPRMISDELILQPSSTQNVPDLGGSSFGLWPNWEPTFVVPEWASQISVIVQSNGLYKPIGGSIIGDWQIEFCIPGTAGTVIGTVIFEEDNNDRPRRASMQVAGKAYVDGRTPGIGNVRGLTRSIRLGARRNAAFSEAGSVLQATNRSSFVMQYRFKELPS